jgi:DNA-binding beta-propeller fold protein YncE
VASNLASAATPTRIEMLVVNTDGDGPTIQRYEAASGDYLGFHRLDRIGVERIDEPRGLGRLGPAGDLLVTARCDNGCDDDAVLRIDPVSGALTRLFDLPANSGGSAQPQALTRGPDGNIYVAIEDPPGVVRRYDPVSGALIDSIPLDFPPATSPYALRFRADGKLLVLTAASEVRLLDPESGVDSGPLVGSGEGGLQAAPGADMIIGKDGSLYVSSPGNDGILRYNAASGAPLGTFVATGDGGLVRPAGLAFSPLDGDLYVVSSGNGAVLRYDGSTGAFKSTPVPASTDNGGLRTPTTLGFAGVFLTPLAQLAPADGSAVDLPVLLRWHPVSQGRVDSHRVSFYDVDPFSAIVDPILTLSVGPESVAALEQGTFPVGSTTFWTVEALRGFGNQAQVVAASERAVAFTVDPDSGEGTLTLIRGLVQSNLNAATLIGAEVRVSDELGTQHVPRGTAPGQQVFVTRDASAYVVLALNTDPYPIILRAEREGYLPGRLEIPAATARLANGAGNAIPLLPGQNFSLTPRALAHGIGLYLPTTRRFLLRGTASGGNADVNVTIAANVFTAQPLLADWDGDGVDTPGLYDPASGRFLIRNSPGNGPIERGIRFGRRGQALVGLAADWDGDGLDTPGLYDPTTGVFFLRQTLLGGEADLTFGFGPRGRAWIPLAGDWNGNGQDTIGLYDPASGRFILRNTNSPGLGDLAVRFGQRNNSQLLPVVGDWNADTVDTIGLYDQVSGRFLLRNSNAPGPADLRFRFGAANAGLRPLAGRPTPP